MGLLIVHTGMGKGKTTAALGMALRAVGHNFRVCVIQFIKGSRKTGESEALKSFNGLLDFYTMGRGFTFRSKDLEQDKKTALEGWAFAKEMIDCGWYRMLILDELTYLIKYRFISEDEMLEALEGRPKELHVVVTGRDAPRSLLEAADLVTEMKMVKHPFRTGVKAQKGIEY